MAVGTVTPEHAATPSRAPGVSEEVHYSSTMPSLRLVSSRLVPPRSCRYCTSTSQAWLPQPQPWSRCVSHPSGGSARALHRPRPPKAGRREAQTAMGPPADPARLWPLARCWWWPPIPTVDLRPGATRNRGSTALRHGRTSEGTTPPPPPPPPSSPPRPSRARQVADVIRIWPSLSVPLGRLRCWAR